MSGWWLPRTTAQAALGLVEHRGLDPAIGGQFEGDLAELGGRQVPGRGVRQASGQILCPGEDDPDGCATSGEFGPLIVLEQWAAQCSSRHQPHSDVRPAGKGCHACERDGKAVGDLGRGELSGVLQAEEFAVLI